MCGDWWWCGESCCGVWWWSMMRIRFVPLGAFLRGDAALRLSPPSNFPATAERHGCSSLLHALSLLTTTSSHWNLQPSTFPPADIQLYCTVDLLSPIILFFFLLSSFFHLIITFLPHCALSFHPEIVTVLLVLHYQTCCISFAF